MTMRIINAGDWSRLVPGNWIDLTSGNRRLVKLEINTDSPTRVSLVDYDANGEEKVTFLGKIDGLEVVEIVVGPEAKVECETEGEVWWFTNDGFASAVEIPEEHSFTQLLQRKDRNDHLETVLRQQAANYERLMRLQDEERRALEERLAANEGAGGTEQPVPPAAPPGETEGPGPVPSPEPEPLPNG